jgi:competence protein ComEC
MSLAETNTNNSSIVLRIEYGSTSFLFTGDAEAEEEMSILSENFDIQSTVLKVGHHGSYTSTSAEFLAAVNPEYAVISVGEGNEYGHPHDEPLARLRSQCGSVYRTDLDGEIVCTSDGTVVTFQFVG